jgi:hypothetical protein
MEENILNIYGVYEFGIRRNDEDTDDQFILYLVGLSTLISFGFKKFFCTKPQYKNKVLSPDSECLICWEKISPGDMYYQCERCKQTYLCEELDKWFASNKNLSCPYCQTWSININYIYINK